MCEIFFIHKSSGTTPEETTSFFRNMLGSVGSNKDGFGFFNDKGVIFKQPKQFESKYIIDLVKVYTGSKFIVGHLRLASHGSVKYENTHPFVYKGKILCHNGVLYGKNFEVNKKEDATDSEKLLRYIVDAEGETMLQKIIKGINDSSGSMSVFLFDKAAQKLYYFRSGSAFSMAFFEDSNIITGATREARLNPFMKVYKNFFVVNDESCVSRDVDEGIYEIDIGTGNIDRIGVITTKTYYHNNQNYSNKRKQVDVECDLDSYFERGG